LTTSTGHLSIEQQAISILENYQGSNNYILKLKKQIESNKKYLPTRAQCDYVIDYNSVVPKVAKKWVEIDSYFSQKLVADNPFIKEPDKIYVEKILVEKDKSYHIWGKIFSGETIHDFWIPRAAVIKQYTENLVDVDYTKYENRPPLAHQKEAIEKLLKNDKFILADDMGLGKALEINTVVYTPNGPKKIGEINIGDNVFGNDGTPYKVTGVFPQGEKKLYRVTFNDGYSVLCCEDHIWNVSTAANGYNNSNRKILTINLTTKQLMDKNSFIKGERPNSKLQPTYYKIPRGGSKWQIPITQPIQFNEQKLPLDPYVLGLLLGDGGITDTSVIFSSVDDELIKSIKNIIGDKVDIIKKKGKNCDYILRKKNNDYKNYISQILKSLDLKGCNSSDKFIPEIYKYTSVKDRLSILQGLMDTDGTCNKSRRKNEFAGTEFSTVSEKLANDVVEIVQSLGGVARKKSRNTTYTYNGEKKQGKLSYRINIKLQRDMNPFRLERKKELYKEPKKYKVARYIKDIQFEKYGEAVCISIDSPNKLYVTEHFIVTHNTTSTVIASLESGAKKVLIICPASLKINWEREIRNYTDKSVYICEGKKYEQADYVILNYDILKNFHDPKDKLNSIILNSKFDLVVIDEAHYVSNAQAQRTKIIMDVTKDIKKLWLLTGTPMTSRPMNYYNILKLIDSPVSQNWQAYAIRYCGGYQFRVGGKKIWNVTGASNLEELRERTSRQILRRLKTEVLDLPEKIMTPVYLRLKSRLYEGLMGEYYDWYNNRQDESRSLSVQFSKLMKVRQVIAEEKIPITIELAENIIEQGKKVIIFSNFTEPLKKIHEHFGKKSVYLDGSTSKPARQDAVDKFQESDKIQVFCGNMKAAGVGLTLTAGEAVIMNDLSFVPAEHAQAEDRAYRYGQKNSVSIYYPLFDNSIEGVIYDILTRKKQIIGTVMGDIDESSVDIVEQILNEINSK
jgi:hypothetical protein